MAESLPFRLNRRGILLALVSAAFAGEAGAVAGRVEFAIGGTTVSGPDGRERPLAKGADLDKGDTVRTTENGRAQIRFTDGAYVSLQPNTEFAIRDYNYEGKTDGSERGIFGLARGAMRTVTGLIGRVNRNRYQITTPTATVGIRGTGGRIEVLLDGSTLIAGTSGIWTLTNPSGTLDVPAGTFGKAPPTPDKPPEKTSEQPKTDPNPPGPVLPQFTQGDQRSATGAPLSLPTVLVSGSGFATAAAFGVGGSPNLLSGSSATATFDAAGQMKDVSFGGNVLKLDPSGAQANFATDGILAWGRWVGLASLTCSGCSPQTYGPNQGLHYVIGMPTPTLPTSGTATYGLAGATSPTYVNGTTTPGSVTAGSLNVTFNPGTASINLVNLTVAMPNGFGYVMNGSTSTSSALFTITSPTVVGSGGACSCGCFSNSAQGFFSGASAERIGLGYHINDSLLQLLGAAAFKK
jgi:FecR protein